MSRIVIPDGYRSVLNLYETQEAISTIKKLFQGNLSHALNLKRVSAPLFVDGASGLNDNLNGVERPVSFDILETGENAEVVHSLAKWKRLALKRYSFPVGEGLYTDMNAIRRDETMDNLHSIYVDQWDWEKVITDEQRTMDTLRDAMERIVSAICVTLDMLRWTYPQLPVRLKRDITFVTTDELERLYPDMTRKQRELAIVRDKKTVCLLRIGWPLSDGQPHDGRAPDYDDWDLNGDILFYHEALDCAMEISSMGVRVSPRTLRLQLAAAHCEDRAELPFHRLLLSGGLPATMGGGIGQSRLCMLLLNKVHIGEVQSSYWDPDTRTHAERAGITLL